MELSDHLLALLETALKGGAGDLCDTAASRCRALCEPPLHLRRVRPDTFVAHSGDPLASIYILLSGSCHILASSDEGKSFVTYVNSGFQIFGLSEALCEKTRFSATISAVQPCCFAVVPTQCFLQALAQSKALGGIVLRYFARLVENAGEVNSFHLLATKYESLLLFLHAQGQSSGLPVQVALSRRALSEQLGISLRTLFRYTDRLIEEGCIHIENGKIAVSKREYQNLQSRAEQICQRISAG